MSRMTLSLALGLAWANVALAEMPQALVDTFARSGAPETAQAEVDAGKAPTWVLERDTGAAEVTVLGVVKLAQSPRSLGAKLFARDSLLEADILKASGSFSEPAVAGDVARYQLPESDLEVLADCEIHACKFKLGEQGLADLKTIDWSAPDARSQVDALFRRRMVEFVQTYQSKGSAGLGRYADKPDAKTVEEAIVTLLDPIRGNALLDSIRSYFLSYPKNGAATKSRLHWNVRDYGYRPVTSIVHTALFDRDGGEPATVVAAKTLYSSHYFYARLQLFLLYADTANADVTYALYGDRMLFDEAVGAVKRKVVRSGVVDDVRKRLTALARTR